MGLIFHRLIKGDLRTIMTHYEEEVGPDLAARFHREFEEVALQIERNPRRFHILSRPPSDLLPAVGPPQQCFALGNNQQ
jgi:plasmid stabilization system protein ParE